MHRDFDITILLREAACVWLGLGEVEFSSEKHANRSTKPGFPGYFVASASNTARGRGATRTKSLRARAINAFFLGRATCVCLGRCSMRTCNKDPKNTESSTTTKNGEVRASYAHGRCGPSALLFSDSPTLGRGDAHICALAQPLGSPLGESNYASTRHQKRSDPRCGPRCGVAQNAIASNARTTEDDARGART